MTRTWRMLALGLTPLAAAVVLVAIGQASVVRALASVALFFLAPGWAITHWLDRDDLLFRTALALSISLALATCVSLTLFYLDQWSWQRCVTALAVVTAVAVVPRLLSAALPHLGWRTGNRTPA
jgi:uncharacterized membrane protein